MIVRLFPESLSANLRNDCPFIPGIRKNNSFLIINPNPNNGKFIVSYDKANSAKFDIKIYNISGEAVFSTKMTSSKISIDLSDKPKGIYFVMTNSRNQNFTNKIIIR